MHPWLALLLTTLRSAMNDFSLISPIYGFDEPLLNDSGENIGYKHTLFEVYLTFVVFILSNIALSMILMNFIIAVISNSYEKVITFAVAHDYRQKATLISELEQLFKTRDLENQKYFPEYIIVRKQKHDKKQIENW